MSFDGSAETSARICPCCLQGVQGKTALDYALEEASPVMRRVIEAVLRRPGMSGNELCDAVYRDDPNGGPEHGIETLRVTIWRENKKLAVHGLRIGTANRGARSGYFLRRVADA